MKAFSATPKSDAVLTPRGDSVRSLAYNSLAKNDIDRRWSSGGMLVDTWYSEATPLSVMTGGHQQSLDFEVTTSRVHPRNPHVRLTQQSAYLSTPIVLAARI